MVDKQAFINGLKADAQIYQGAIQAAMQQVAQNSSPAGKLEVTNQIIAILESGQFDIFPKPVEPIIENQPEKRKYNKHKNK